MINKLDPRGKGEAPRLVVRVPAPVLSKLEKLAAREGHSVSGLVRFVLREYTEGRLVRKGGK